MLLSELQLLGLLLAGVKKKKCYLLITINLQLGKQHRCRIKPLVSFSHQEANLPKKMAVS